MLGHLQVYSSYSFQNSTILIEDLVKKASDLHYEALALTDKDNMYGAMELAKYAKKYGIKAVFGLEASVEINHEDVYKRQGLYRYSFTTIARI